MSSIERFYERSNVYGLVANLTVVTMLAHALLGCCWHHGHADRPEQPGRQAAFLSHAGCHHDGHSCSRGTPQQEDHPTPDDCDGSRCLFVGSTRTLAAQQVSSAQNVASLTLVENHELPSSPPLCTSTDRLSRPALPDRTYVWHQVFLL